MTPVSSSPAQPRILSSADSDLIETLRELLRAAAPAALIEAALDRWEVRR